MPVQSAATLKSYFIKRRVPTESNYIDLIDSIFGGSGVGEGPGIDVAGGQVGIGGDSILLHHNNLNPVSEYVATSTGLVNALAAMVAGDVLMLPDTTIAGGPWTLAHGILIGHSRFGSILDGVLNVHASCIAGNLSTILSVSSVNQINGIVIYDDGLVDSCFVRVTNLNKDAVGIYSHPTSRLDCYPSNNIIIVVSVAGGGYAFMAAGGGWINVIGGMVRATTSPIGIAPVLPVTY